MTFVTFAHTVLAHKNFPLKKQQQQNCKVISKFLSSMSYMMLRFHNQLPECLILDFDSHFNLLGVQLSNFSEMLQRTEELLWMLQESN